jgi:hypothetical protein
MGEGRKREKEAKDKRRIRKRRKTKERRMARKQKMSVNEEPKQNGCSVMSSLHPAIWI